jgi:diguanylate cyclase (GGDEF)-like protein
MAHLLRRHLREYDLAARYGGEEFALVLPETELDRALHVAERIRKEAGQLQFEGAMAGQKLTVSLGVACAPHPHINSVDDLIRLADDALYKAKNEGRNCIRSMADL